VSDRDLNWKYVDESVVETDAVAKARQQSLELGIEPVLWMLQTVRSAMLTSIDTENEYQQHAREHFADAGIAPARVRLIAGRASEVLPRMNEDSYDVVFIDADATSVIEYVEHGLRLAKTGGTVLVARALWKGRVADPARRDDAATAFRELIAELAASSAVATAVSPAGDGLLQIVKLGA
jgi:predicted O-methyltransferase YrrM